MNDLFTYGLYLGFDKESVKDAIHDVFLKLSTNSNPVSYTHLDVYKRQGALDGSMGEPLMLIGT